MTALLARYRGAIAAVVNGIAGVLVGPTTIATSTAATASAYSNQRKVDRCQNGVLWAHCWDGQANFEYAMDFVYSTDNGATWTNTSTNGFQFAGTASNYTPNASMFIDLDDYCHVVYKDRHDGYIYYRRGTPNAGRTAWTWSAATAIETGVSCDHPDVIAHREGTDWAAHVVYGITSSGSGGRTFYRRVTITSGGGISVSGSTELSPGPYGGHQASSYPSIDFNHTGDGKTVAGGTPHLYVAWSAGQTSAGNGIRFKKATYSGGTWTWGTEREIDNANCVEGSGYYWLNCLFDGTRVLIGGGSLWTGGSSQVNMRLYQRDANDTTTTTFDLGSNLVNADRMNSGSMTYDATGNVYFFGAQAGTSGSVQLRYQKWTRTSATTGTLGPVVAIDATSPGLPYVSAKRGYSNNRIEWIYTDGTASPYNVTYGSILLAEANSWVPAEISNAGTATSKTITNWPNDTDTFQYAIATADAGGLGAYSNWRNLNPWEFYDKASGLWTVMEEEVNTGTESSLAWPSPVEKGTYLWTAATADAFFGGPYASAYLLLVGGAFERWGWGMI